MPEQLYVCCRCGFEFYSAQPSARHCSKACKQAIYRIRKSKEVTRRIHLVNWGLEDEHMPARLLDADDVANRLRCSRSYVGTLTNTDPSFPKPRKLGRLLRWSESELDAWIGGRGDTVQSRPAEAYQQRVV